MDHATVDGGTVAAGGDAAAITTVSPDLAQLLDDATQLRSDRIELKPLGDERFEALVRAELGVPAGETLTGVVGRVAGNPLWVIELLPAITVFSPGLITRIPQGGSAQD